MRREDHASGAGLENPLDRRECGANSGVITDDAIGERHIEVHPHEHAAAGEREISEGAFGHTLDKFIGDAIMALWGAPIAHSDDPDRALDAAIAMQKAIEELNRGWTASGRPEIGVGIGLSHGEVFAGNIGSHRRLEYTVLGDAVNVAARLCAEAGPGEILVSEALLGVVRKHVDHEYLPELGLKGKSQVVQVYRLKSSGEGTPEAGPSRRGG
jgi:class 3 adenylate cyclase